MVAKENLLSIPDLNLSGRIEIMDAVQLDKYEKALGLFVESVQTEGTKIKTALEKWDYDSLAASLSAVCEKLEEIFAEDLAEECRKHIGKLKKTKHDRIEAYVKYFLACATALSSDIKIIASVSPSPSEEKEDDDDSFLDTKSAPAPASASARFDKTILAVDDAPLFLTMLKTIVQETPYKIVCLNSGAAALRYLEQNRPDLFILDIEMPIMSGIELAEKIRAIGQTAPIIFMTGNATEQDVVKAIKAGASDYVVKPIDKMLVLEKIFRFI